MKSTLCWPKFARSERQPSRYSQHMPLPPSPEPPRPPEGVNPGGGTIATRVWDAVKKLAAITEHLRTLEKEDARIQLQLLEPTRIVLGLSNDVHDLLGQMRGIEKRLEDRDKLVDAMIKVRIMEEIEKLRSELFGPHR